MKKLIFTTLLLVLSFPAGANDDLLSILDGGTEEEVVPERDQSQRQEATRRFMQNTTPEQNIFFGFFERGDYEKALFQWRSAFSDGPYTDQVRALYGFVLLKNGLTIAGVETLFGVEKPESLPAELVGLWKEELPGDSKIWELVHVGWKPGWTAVFGPTAEAKNFAANSPSLSDTEAIEARLRQTSSGSWERNWLQWQFVLSLALKDDVAKAARLLNNLMTAPNNPVSPPLMNITAARMLYERGFLDAAVEYYQRVPKSSEYWWDAQEEIGWAYTRKGESQNTLAVTEGLLRKEFAPLVGPETIFLRALAQLKVCDYPAVVDTVKVFRDRYRSKAQALLQITSGERDELLTQFINDMAKKEKNLLQMGAMASELPRFITRDETLLHRIRVYRQLQAESEVASKLYSRSLTGGTAEVGFQAPIESLRTSVDSRARQALTAGFQQIKKLSDREITEIRAVLDRMHIVEAELLQQISQAERVIADSSDKIDVKKGTTGSKARDTVWFVHDGEFWFDEISNYQITIKKGCQAKKAM